MGKNKRQTPAPSIAQTTKPKKEIPLVENTPHWKRVWFPALLLFAITFFLYSNTFHHRFVLDDHGIIKNNKITKAPVSWDNTVKIFTTPLRKGDFSDLENSLYRPVVKLLFNLEWNMFDGDPHRFHMMNVILFGICVIILWGILYEALRKNALLAFAIALLFATHPIHTEVVANVKSADEILSLLGILLAMRCIQLYLKHSKQLYLILAIPAFLMASFSKESTVVAVALFPLFIYFFTSASWKKNIILSSIMLLCTLFFLYCRHATLSKYPDKGTLSALDNFMVLCTDPSYAGTSQFASAVRTLGLYLMTFLYPHPLSCDYSYSSLIPVGFSDPGFIFSFLILAGLLGYAIFLFIPRKNSLVNKPALSFSLLWFFIAMSITSNVFFLIGTSFGERLLFVPSVGLTMALVLLMARFLQKKSPEEQPLIPSLKASPVFTLLLFGITLLYSIKTWSRNADWKSDFSLFSKDVESYPNSTHLLFYMANHLSGSDFKDNLALDIEENHLNIDLKDSVLKANYRCIQLFNKALSIYPALPSDGYNQLGKAYFNTGRLDSAEKYYQKALDEDSTNPIYTNNLGTVYYNSSIPLTQKGADFQKAGQLDSAQYYSVVGTNRLLEALPYFLKAHKGDSTETDFINNIGCIYGATQRSDSAIYWFRKAYELDRYDEVSIQFLEITYRAIGKTSDADFFKARLAEARAHKNEQLR